jgi:hypothetical protein
LDKKVEDLQTNFINNYLGVVEKYIQDNYKDLVSLREQVIGEIENLPIGNINNNIRKIERKIEYIENVYKEIQPENIVNEVLRESLSEPSFSNNKDPLTPLDKKFVTFQQLQDHYRLFINRIQQQLSTLGGGGETRLMYLDDVSDIALSPSDYDGKYLRYNHSIKKFEFVDIDINNFMSYNIDGGDADTNYTGINPIIAGGA